VKVPQPNDDGFTHRRVCKWIFEVQNVVLGGTQMITKNRFQAFVFGGLVGAAVGLLYAPHAGEKTRKILVNNGQVVKDKAITSLHEAQVRMEAFTEETKKRLEKLEEIVQHTFEEEKQILKEGLKQAKEVVGGNGNNGVSGAGEIYS